MDREDALRRQFVREARIGVGLIGIALAVFLALASLKLSGAFRRSTEAIVAGQQASSPDSRGSAPQSPTTNITAAALQAATESVIDHVQLKKGDTSAIKAPPMPGPRTSRFEEMGVPTGRSFQSDGANAAPHPAPNQRGVTGTFAPIMSAEPRSTRPADHLAAPGGESKSSFYTQSPAVIPATGRSNPGERPPLKHENSDNFLSLVNHPIPGKSLAPDPSIAAQAAQADAKTDADFTDVEPGVERPFVWSEGDSLWSIAQQSYGDGRLFRALAAYNQIGNSSSESVMPGTEIRIPAIEQLHDRFPTLIPADLRRVEDNVADPPFIEPSPRIYATRPGDTLFAIARDELGQASRFVDIIRLNAEQLPAGVTSSTKLPGGISLRLAEK